MKRKGIFSAVVLHELARVVKSPRWWNLSVATVTLLLVSGLNFLGYQRETRAAQAETNNRLRETLSVAKTAAGLRVAQIELTKGPRPTDIFAFGFERLVPNTVSFNMNDLELRTEHALEHNLFLDIPRQLDWSFVVLYCMSLGTLLLGHDAVSRELENGTLKLVIVNPISRAALLAGKTTGLWLAVVIPLVFGALLGAGFLTFAGVAFRPLDAAVLGLSLAVSLIFLLAVLLASIWISILSRSSAISLTLVAVLWIGIVFVVPGLSRTTAEFLVPISDVSLESEIAQLAAHRAEQGIHGDYRALVSEAREAHRLRIRSKVQRQLEIASWIDSLALSSVYRDSIAILSDCCLPRQRAFLANAESYLSGLESLVDSVRRSPQGELPQLPVFRDRELDVARRLRAFLSSFSPLPVACLILFVCAFFSFVRMDVTG